MTRCSHIVPISFFGGTGGHFLASFITAAKLNSTTLIKLSDAGNAHFSGFIELEASPLFQAKPDTPDIDRIEAILNSTLQPNFPDIKPWIVKEHIFDLDLVTKYFEKSIRIVYDMDDVHEIALLRIRKTTDEMFNWRTLATVKAFAKHSQPKFTKQDKENVLFISWKDIYVNDMTELVTKLSNFMQIPYENFNLKNLEYWRAKTSQCIIESVNYEQRTSKISKQQTPS